MKTFKITFTIRPAGDDDDGGREVKVTTQLEAETGNDVIFDTYSSNLCGWVVGDRFVNRKYVEDVEVVEVA